MKWGKAFAYGLKYLVLSAAFNIIGLIMILSALSINMSLKGSDVEILINTSNVLANIGSLILLVMGFSIIVLGNVASFVKVLIEAIGEHSKEILW